MNILCKKTFAWLIVFCMVMTLIPMSVYAEEETTITTALDFTASGDTSGEGYVWTETEKTLTLSGLVLETPDKDAMTVPDGTTIILNGANTVTSTYNGDEFTCGIQCIGILTIQGDGSLTVTGGDNTNSFSYGIVAPTLNIVGGTITAAGGDSGNTSIGISVREDFTISGGDVTAVGGAGEISWGICASKTMNITSGTINAAGGNGTMISHGIHSGGNFNPAYEDGSGVITISGGTVTATGDNGANLSYGIYALKSIEISNGLITANGGTAASDSHGMFIDGMYFDDINTNAFVSLPNGGNITISGGTVIASGNTAKWNSGIYARNDFTISGSATSVTAIGGNASGNANSWSYGIYAGNTMEIFNGTVTAASGTATGGGAYSYGVRAGNTLDISGGNITAEAGSADTYSCGVRTNNFTVSGGDLKAIGGPSGDNNSYGIRPNPDQTFSILGGTLVFQGNNQSITLDATVISLPTFYWYRTNTDAFAGGTWTSSSAEEFTNGISYKYVEITDIDKGGDEPVANYTVMYNANGGSGTMASGTAAQGDNYTIASNAFYRTDYSFNGWNTQSDGGGTAYAEGAIISNVQADITLYAQWRYIGGGYTPPYIPPYTPPADNGSSGDSTPSGSGSSGSGTSGNTNPAPPASENPVVQINGVTTDYTIDANGNVTLTPTSAQMKKIIENNRGGVLAINLGTLSGVNSVSFEFSPSLIPKSITSIKITHDKIGSCEIKSATISKLKGKVTVVLRIGSLILDILVDGKSVSVTDYANPMTISIPYKLQSGELASQVVMTNKKTGKAIPRSYYKDGYVYATVYSTGHFEPTCIKPTKFTDTMGTWSDESVKYMSSRGVINGVTETTFEPNTAITREQYIAMLVSLLDLTGVDYSATEPFADVDKKDPYYSAIMRAKTLGITNGIGNNHFGRDLTITLEDMYTITYRAMKQFGMAKDFDKTKGLDSFSDSDKVSSYAVEAIQNLLQNGIVKSETFLNPKVTASRGVTALFMYRLLLSEK